MADKEISELTAATTPLAGTELIHIDQGGNSRKVALTDVAAISTGAMLKATYDPNDDGIISVANGGTNSATAAGARTNLGLGTMAVQNATTVAITGGSVTGITDITVADGGTGASTASGARTNLELVYGVNVQAWNANLDGFAATTVANVQNRVNHTGTQLAATISDFSTAADARVSAAIGSTVQAYDALLTSVSTLSLAAGDIIYATGADTVARLPKGANGQVLALQDGVPQWDTELVVGGLLAANDLSDVADAATALTNLGAQAASVTPDDTPQSESGTAIVYPRTVVEIIQNERPSIYEFLSEADRADIRTGLLSTSCLTAFEQAKKKYNPGATSIPGGAKIHIPSGLYKIDTGGIPMQDSIEWDGENKEGTRIQQMGNFPIFTSQGTSANQVGRCAVRNMTLIGAGKANFYGYGIELIWMNNPSIYNVQFQALRWCITQSYTVNAFIQECTSVGSSNTIYGYLWKKAIDSTLHPGTDNTTTISDVYFMAGDVAMVLHGSNGIQMGGNVALLQCGVRVGAIAETESDGSAFTPGANNDVIHFQHWDGLRLDTIVNDRAIRIVKGAMAAPHDIRLTSLWAGNITGSNSYVLDVDGVEDFEIVGGNIDVTGQVPFLIQNSSRGLIKGLTVRNYGGNNNQNAALIQSSAGIDVEGNTFYAHASNTSPNGVRAESSSGIGVRGNYFDWRGATPSASICRRTIFVNTTGSVAANNTTSNLASYPCIESGTSNNNRIHDNPSTQAPTLVGANSLGHHNNAAGT